MIYISPTGSFDNPREELAANDAGQLIKVQIENSLALGWKQEDIMLMTNFNFQYGPIKATILEDVEFFEPKPQASKINAIIKLSENGIIKNKELYWFHDIDAFQLYPIQDSEIDIEDTQIALTTYGRYRKWNTGSIFFKSKSLDIFSAIREVMYKMKIDEERVLSLLTTTNIDLKNRVKEINRTYNFTAFNLRSSYKTAIKPIRVVHFHPQAYIRQLQIENPLDFFKGNNHINTPLVTKQLLRIFKYHRIS